MTSVPRPYFGKGQLSEFQLSADAPELQKAGKVRQQVVRTLGSFAR